MVAFLTLCMQKCLFSFGDQSLFIKYLLDVIELLIIRYLDTVFLIWVSPAAEHRLHQCACSSCTVRRVTALQQLNWSLYWLITNRWLAKCFICQWKALGMAMPSRSPSPHQWMTPIFATESEGGFWTLCWFVPKSMCDENVLNFKAICSDYKVCQFKIQSQNIDKNMQIISCRTLIIKTLWGSWMVPDDRTKDTLMCDSHNCLYSAQTMLFRRLCCRIVERSHIESAINYLSLAIGER